MTKKRSLLLDWKVWLGFAISVLALWWTFKDADLEGILKASRNIHWPWLISSIPLFLALLVLRAYRWRYFIDKDASTLRSKYNAMNIGFMMNMILPLRMGEVVRAVYFARKNKRSGAEILATIAAERVFDLISLGFIAVAVMPFLPYADIAQVLGSEGTRFEITRRNMLGFSVGLISILLGGFLLVCRFGPRILEFLVARLRLGGSVIHRILKAFLKGIDAPMRTGRLMKTLLISFLTWCLFVLANWFALHAFPAGDTNLGEIAGLVGATWYELVMCVGIAAPSTPGFVGVWHAAAKFSFLPYAVGHPGIEDAVLAFAVIFHAFNFLVTILFGFESFVNEGASWSALREAEEVGENNGDSSSGK